MERITAKGAKFIKLGQKGAWEHLCLEDGTIRLGFHTAGHDAALAHDEEALKQSFSALNKTQGTSTNYARQVLQFYQAGPDTIWITFVDGFLYWSRAEQPVEILGYDNQVYREGSRLRRTMNGWSNTSLKGRQFNMNRLNGELTAVAQYQSTICSLNPRMTEYLLRLINDERMPEVDRAHEVRSQMCDVITNLMKLLPWRDFEVLVELIFSQSGWRRIGETGGTQKTVDIELILPSTKERAFVQVKSRTTQSQLDEYLDRFSGRNETRMFYVYHSAERQISADDPRITVIGPEELAEMVLNAGLVDWLIEKVG